MADWFIVAMDTGNGELKIVSDAVDHLSVGGVLGRYRDVPGGRTRLSKNEEIDVYQVEDDEQKWVIGYQDCDRLGLQSLLVSGRDALIRYSGTTFQTYAKIGLAKAVGKQKPSKILLLTSVPAYDALNNKVVSRLGDVFNDVHKVKVNGERKLLPVMHYEPISETEAVIYDLYLDKDGFKKDATIAEQDVLVINAGFGTTDISRYNRLEFIKLDRETVKTSYYDVLQRCKQWLDAVIGREITVQDIATQLSQQYDQAVKRFIYVGEEVQDFDAMYKGFIKGVFYDLMAELNNIVPDPDVYHRIVVVGGAAIDTIWGDLFRQWSRRVQIPNDPQFAAARGMYNFGHYVASELSDETAASED